MKKLSTIIITFKIYTTLFNMYVNNINKAMKLNLYWAPYWYITPFLQTQTCQDIHLNVCLSKKLIQFQRFIIFYWLWFLPCKTLVTITIVCIPQFFQNWLLVFKALTWWPSHCVYNHNNNNVFHGEASNFDINYFD